MNNLNNLNNLNNNNNESFQCSKCNFRAKYIEIINSHYNEIHATKEEKKTNHKFYCEPCNLGINDKYLSKFEQEMSSRYSVIFNHHRTRN